MLARFEADPTQIQVIERDLKLAEPIIRYLLVKPEPEKAPKDEE